MTGNKDPNHRATIMTISRYNLCGLAVIELTVKQYAETLQRIARNFLTT